MSRGVQILDDWDPTWHERIDTARIRTPDHVLDQLFGDYFDGVRALQLRYAPLDYGFDDGISTPELLAAEWRRVVEERR